MSVSIEWFLLDNTMMNLCIFLLASALSGTRVRFGPVCLFSIAGAVYALLSLFVWPWLGRLPVKLIAFITFALPMREKGTSLLIMTVCLLLSAAMIGGAVVGIALLTGGTVMMNGTIIGTLPLRSALIALSIVLLLPRIVRSLLQRREPRSLYTDILVQMPDSERQYRALIDTGNLLIEPVSGLPILLLYDADVPPERMVVYATQNGEGILFAAKPKRVSLPDYGDCEINCYVARAVQPIPDAEAVLPAKLLPYHWRKRNEKTLETHLGTDTAVDAPRPEKRRMVYTQRRNLAAAARSGRRSPLPRSSADGKVGKG